MCGSYDPSLRHAGRRVIASSFAGLRRSQRRHVVLGTIRHFQLYAIPLSPPVGLGVADPFTLAELAINPKLAPFEIMAVEIVATDVVGFDSQLPDGDYLVAMAKCEIDFVLETAFSVGGAPARHFIEVRVVTIGPLHCGQRRFRRNSVRVTSPKDSIV